MDPADSESKMEFEVVLNNGIGEFGKYQVINLIFLTLPVAVSGFMAGDYIFTAARLPHRCAIPECDGPQPEYAPGWIYNAIPARDSGFDDCLRFGNLTTSETQTEGYCPASLFNRSIQVPCEAYVYERTNSVVYDFNLECNEWLRALAGTLNSAGAMVALPLAGFISDKFGRRVSIAFFCFNIALVGVLKSLSVNYAMYATMQFAMTALGGGSFSAAYVLATEIVGPKFRVITSATISSMFALGQVLLGVIASLIYNWRHLTLVLFTPVILLVSYPWVVTESPRWLLSKDKKDRARATIENAARLNNKTISEQTMEYLLTAIPKQLAAAKNANANNERNMFFRVLKSPVMLRRCCTTPILWITTTFIYYGLSINSVSLSGNMYLNYIATAAIEIPGYWTAVLVLDRMGRRISLFIGFSLCGLCCIAFAFTPKTMTGLSLFLFLTGKYFIGFVITSVYLFTAELYPTRHRHSFLGFSSMLGRIGSIVAPLTPPLMDYWTGIPSMMFGTLSVISGLLVLSQPETKGLKVPDTFEDAEQLGRT